MAADAGAGDHDTDGSSRYCDGPLRHREGTCTRPAGWGTPHPGIGRCKLHGGSTPSHVKAAQKVAAEVVLRKVWNLDAAPVTDSVGALQRLAGRLEAAVDAIGAELAVGEPCECCGRGGVELDGVNASAWIRAVRESRTALVEMERLGIASRGLEINEKLAGELSSVIRRVLDRLQLNEKQLVLVPVVVPEELRRVASAVVPSPPELGPGGGSDE